MKRLIAVAGEGQRREAWLLDGDAEFFLQFADQRRFGPLPGLKLAAGEFP